jgi:hypothetical protein
VRVGCRLREIRGKRTLAGISAAAGVPMSALSMIERGRELPRDDWLPGLEQAYGVPRHEWWPPEV